VLVLCWFRERSCVHRLARDAGVSQATGHRYLHEGMTHVILDGRLIECDRLVQPETQAFGGDVRFLSTPDGTPTPGPIRAVRALGERAAAELHTLCGVGKVM
jgi:hypothetical protein